MSHAAYVLQEIAGQESRGGAREATIRTMVDGRQRVLLSEDELRQALVELESRNLIVRAGEMYHLAPTFMVRVPKAPEGGISLVREQWEQLAEELGLGGAAP